MAGRLVWLSWLAVFLLFPMFGHAAVVLGKHPSDTITAAFFGNNTNADRIIEGLNAHGTLPLTVSVQASPLEDMQTLSVSVTNQAGDVITITNNQFVLQPDSTIVDGIGNTWGFDTGALSMVARKLDIELATNSLAGRNEVTNHVTAAIATKADKTGDTLSGTFVASPGMVVQHDDGDGTVGNFSFGVGTNQSANTVSRIGVTETLMQKTLAGAKWTGLTDVSDVFLVLNNSGTLWNFQQGVNAGGNTVATRSVATNIANAATSALISKTQSTNLVQSATNSMARRQEATNLVQSATNALLARVEGTNLVQSATNALLARVEGTNLVQSATNALLSKVEGTNLVQNSIAGKVDKTGDTLSGTFTAQEGMAIFHDDGDGVSGQFSFGLGTNQSANTVSRIGATETLENKTLLDPAISGTVNMALVDDFQNGAATWNWKETPDTLTVATRGYVDGTVSGKMGTNGGTFLGSVVIQSATEPQLRIKGNLQVDGYIDFLTDGLFLVPADDYPESTVVIGPKIGMAGSGGEAGVVDYLLSPTNHLGLVGYLSLEDSQANPASAGMILGMQHDNFVPLYIQSSLTPGTNFLEALGPEQEILFSVTSVGGARGYNFISTKNLGSDGVLRSVAGEMLSAGTTTSHLAEGANLYFTEARVRSSPLTGLDDGTGGQVTDTDTILEAFGKLENRVALNDAKVTGADRVAKSGDTMTGALTLPGSPTLDLQAATKEYVDDQIATNSIQAVLTGLDTGTASAVVSTDTVLEGIGKLDASRANLANIKLARTNGVAVDLAASGFTLNAGLKFNPGLASPGAALTTNQTLISIATLSSGQTNTLPDADDHFGQWYLVRDGSGQASVNPIVLYPALGDTIAGATQKVINVDYGWAMIASIGSGWAWMPGPGDYTESQSSVLFRGTADATVANSVTESTIVPSGVGSMTLPANWWQPGRSLRLNLLGSLSTKSGGDTLTVRVKVGGTTLASDTMTLPSLLNGDGFELSFVLSCRATGAPGTFRGRGQFHCPDGPDSDTDQRYVVSGSTGYDTTGSGLLDVTMQWGSVNAANTVTTEIMSVEVLP